jgi:hypothetical protein
LLSGRKMPTGFGASLEEETSLEELAGFTASLELDAGTAALDAGAPALDAGASLEAGPTSALETGFWTSALEAGASALDAGTETSALELGTDTSGASTEEEELNVGFAASELDTIPGSSLFGLKLGAVEAPSPQFIKARAPVNTADLNNPDFIH